MNTYDYRTDVPEGTFGSAEIARFEISKNAAAFACIRDGHRAPMPGTYTGLRVNGVLWMSDTGAEMRDHASFVRYAHGRVLVTGLGLGCVADLVASKESVSHVTIVEMNADVIALVEPWLTAKHPGKITVVNADAHEWLPPKGTHYDCAWHDIWANICADNWDGMKAIRRHYSRCVERGGQSCWVEWEVKRLVRQDREDEKRRSMWRQAIGGSHA